MHKRRFVFVVVVIVVDWTPLGTSLWLWWLDSAVDCTGSVTTGRRGGAASDSAAAAVRGVSSSGRGPLFMGGTMAQGCGGRTNPKALVLGEFQQDDDDDDTTTTHRRLHNSHSAPHTRNNHKNMHPTRGSMIWNPLGSDDAHTR